MSSLMKQGICRSIWFIGLQIIEANSDSFFTQCGYAMCYPVFFLAKRNDLHLAHLAISFERFLTFEILEEL